uniref:Dynein_C domain-containing protein n=1 Tax=Macrostomum lignano TaxID=282301 RepID=A0A1I8FK54_9PLAT
PDTESGEVALVIRKKLLNAWAPCSANPGPGWSPVTPPYLRSLGHGSVPVFSKLLPQVREFLNHLERASGDILIDVEGRQQLMNALRVVRNNLVACGELLRPRAQFFMTIFIVIVSFSDL